MKIICYGASNTYGTDPRTYTGESYRHTWTDLLCTYTGLEVVNLGQPGRRIPENHLMTEAACRSIESVKEDDTILIIMLGTNDLLSGADAETTAKRMEFFLSEIRRMELQILLLGIPPLRDHDVKELNSLLEKPAEHIGILFLDTSAWLPEMAFDGVHLSEKDQYLYAEKLSEYIKKLRA